MDNFDELAKLRDKLLNLQETFLYFLKKFILIFILFIITMPAKINMVLSNGNYIPQLQRQINSASLASAPIVATKSVSSSLNAHSSLDHDQAFNNYFSWYHFRSPLTPALTDSFTSIIAKSNKVSKASLATSNRDCNPRSKLSTASQQTLRRRLRRACTPTSQQASSATIGHSKTDSPMRLSLQKNAPGLFFKGVGHVLPAQAGLLGSATLSRFGLGLAGSVS